MQENAYRTMLTSTSDQDRLHYPHFYTQFCQLILQFKHIKTEDELFKMKHTDEGRNATVSLYLLQQSTSKELAFQI